MRFDTQTRNLPFKEKTGQRKRKKVRGLHVFRNRPNNLWVYRKRKWCQIVPNIRHFLQEKAAHFGAEEVLMELAWLYSAKVFYIPRTGRPAEPAIYVVAPGGLNSENLAAVQYDRLVRRWSFLPWPLFIDKLAADPEMKNLYQIGTLKEYRR